MWFDSSLIFSLAGDSLKKLFDSFAQFFTEQHKKILIILKINYFYLAGFSRQIMFPEHTLSLASQASETFLDKQRLGRSLEPELEREGL